MKEDESLKLPFKHWSESKKQEIDFKFDVLKRGDNYQLVKPEKQFFVQMIRFAPGKGPNDYVKFFKDIDQELNKKYKSHPKFKGHARHDVLGIHEMLTFITYGRYDMVAIYYAPSLAEFNEFINSYINPNANSFGSTETLVGASELRHDPL